MMNCLLVIALFSTTFGYPQGMGTMGTMGTMDTMGTDGMGTMGTMGTGGNFIINPGDLGHWCEVYEADPVMWDMPFSGTDVNEMPSFSPDGMIYAQDLGAWCRIYNLDPEMWDQGYVMGPQGKSKIKSERAVFLYVHTFLARKFKYT